MSVNSVVMPSRFGLHNLVGREGPLYVSQKRVRVRSIRATTIIPIFGLISFLGAEIRRPGSETRKESNAHPNVLILLYHLYPPFSPHSQLPKMNQPVIVMSMFSFWLHDRARDLLCCFLFRQHGVRRSAQDGARGTSHHDAVDSP